MRVVSRLLKRLIGRGGGAKPQPRTAVVGAWGEEKAAEYLKANGYTLLGRNVRPDKRDEIDIVARIGETLVFVEVKTRRREEYGRPFMAVDKDKRHALNRAAAAYLRRTRFPNLFYRFDVIEVLGQPEQGEPVIRHLDNAFPFEERFKFPV